MLDGLEALIALNTYGTVSEAAVRLRLTQSAISKRIQTLEAQLSYKVVEPEGRRLKLTSKGSALLSEAKPLIAALRDLKVVRELTGARQLEVGIADSVACSWGPALLQKARSHFQNISVELHVHRSTMVIELIRLGKYDMGIVSGAPSALDLAWHPLSKEEMVLFGRKQQSKRILTIESASATWREVGKELSAHKHLLGCTFVPVESFVAAIQMAKAGWGQALFPIGLAKTVGLRSRDLIYLSPKVNRQVQVVMRKTLAQVTDVAQFAAELEKSAASIIRT